MTLGVILSLQTFGIVWEVLVQVLCMFGRIIQWRHLVLDLVCREFYLFIYLFIYLFTDSFSLLVISLFKLSISSSLCVCVCVCVRVCACVYLCLASVFFKKHLYWSIIALQWCVTFCFITKWISYTYKYVPISLPSCISLPPPSLSHPSRWSQSTELISLCYVAASY